ncbi:MAG TPA: Gfo/Idh/MocA family oxidoreductase [Abditibacterium sp.]|jgi:predicted dehydrogenase
MKKKCIMLGVGGMASHWIFDFWARQAHRMEFAALVDVNADALQSAAARLGLPSSALFTDAEAAFQSVEADFCCIVTPPQFHRGAVELAAALGLDILSEKPIAATWDDTVSIYQTVKSAGVKMLVTQNYRYTPRILTLKKAISELGKVNYAVGRYTSDYRVRGSWGAEFRHAMPHSLLVEGGIHHFDQLRNLTGGDALTISGYEWHPGFVRGSQTAFGGGESFEGEPCALFVMQMHNGAFAHYEGNNLESGKTNSWHCEHYRVECEGGAAILDSDHKVWILERKNGELVEREVETIEVEFNGHAAMPEQFLNWLEGGETPATVLEDNIKSNATLFAAILASEEKRVVNVAEMLQNAIGA